MRCMMPPTEGAMAYRDELEAAKAKIIALEQQLADQQLSKSTKTTGSYIRENQTLKRELAIKNHKIQEQELQIQSMRSGLQANERQLQNQQDTSHQFLSIT